MDAFVHQKLLIVFVLKNIHCMHLLETPLRGTYNDHPQHMFFVKE